MIVIPFDKSLDAVVSRAVHLMHQMVDRGETVPDGWESVYEAVVQEAGLWIIGPPVCRFMNNPITAPMPVQAEETILETPLTVPVSGVAYLAAPITPLGKTDKVSLISWYSTSESIGVVKPSWSGFDPVHVMGWTVNESDEIRLTHQNFLEVPLNWQECLGIDPLADLVIRLWHVMTETAVDAAPFKFGIAGRSRAGVVLVGADPDRCLIP